MKSPLNHSAITRFGVFEFNSATGELRKNGLRVRLNRQSARLLNILLKADGKLCLRGELRRELWPGDTAVDFEHSLNKAIWGLRQALGDFASSPRYIETVAGQGYRFLVFTQQPVEAANKASKSNTLESLAVIPLANLSGSEECAFLAGQIACRLTHKLSAVPKLRVLAYSTVKQYNLAGMDPRTAGNQLGVKAALTGEILQYNGDLILNVELIEIGDGTHLWGTQLKESWPQAADHIEQIADEVMRQMQAILSRTRNRVQSDNSEEKPAGEKKPARAAALKILKPPALLPAIQAKKAFSFS